ncbi:MAG: MAPEG family protein [Gammaproteobacteria bacterium AqS3]|nr:MAPEG family protein [Gammaproteobacteria bacterium AqS3]
MHHAKEEDPPPAQTDVPADDAAAAEAAAGLGQAIDMDRSFEALAENNALMFDLALPAAALIGWTLAVLLVMVCIRVGRARRDPSVLPYYGVYDGENPGSRTLKRIERQFANLLEVPLLFYALIALALILGIADGVFVVLAWVFVGLRILHSIWHIAVNSVPIRGLIWGLATIVLIWMWVRVMGLIIF